MTIYKTTNLINGKIYIGFDTHRDPRYLGSGKLLQRSVDKYGRCHFIKELIETCKTLDELKCREIYWIKHFNSTDKRIGYNITTGGAGGDTYTNHPDYKNILKKLKFRKHYVMTDDIRKKISLSNKNKPKSKEHRNKLRLAQLGKRHTEESKQKMSVAHMGEFIGKNNPMYGKPAWNRGKKLSEEIKKKMRGDRPTIIGKLNPNYKLIPKNIKEYLIKNYLIESKVKLLKTVHEMGYNISRPTLNLKLKEMGIK